MSARQIEIKRALDDVRAELRPGVELIVVTKRVSIILSPCFSKYERPLLKRKVFLAPHFHSIKSQLSMRRFCVDAVLPSCPRCIANWSRGHANLDAI